MRESGGVSFVCSSPDWRMEWTESEAGVSLGNVDRRGGSGFEES